MKRLNPVKYISPHHKDLKKDAFNYNDLKRLEYFKYIDNLNRFELVLILKGGKGLENWQHWYVKSKLVNF